MLLLEEATIIYKRGNRIHGRCESQQNLRLCGRCTDVFRAVYSMHLPGKFSKVRLPNS